MKFYTLYTDEKDNLNLVTSEDNKSVKFGGRKNYKKKNNKRKTLIGGGVVANNVSDDVNQILTILKTFDSKNIVSEEPVEISPNRDVYQTGLDTARYMSQSCRYLDSLIQQLDSTIEKSKDGLQVDNDRELASKIMTVWNTKKLATEQDKLFEQVSLYDYSSYEPPELLDEEENVGAASPRPEQKTINSLKEFISKSKFKQHQETNPLYYEVKNHTEMEATADTGLLSEKRPIKLTFDIEDKGLNLQNNEKYQLEIKLGNGEVSQFSYEPEDDTKGIDFIIISGHDLDDDNIKAGIKGVLFTITRDTPVEEIQRLLVLNTKIAGEFVNQRKLKDLRDKYIKKRLLSTPILFSDGVGDTGLRRDRTKSFEKPPRTKLDKGESVLERLSEKHFKEHLWKKGFDPESNSLFNNYGFTQQFEDDLENSSYQGSSEDLIESAIIKRAKEQPETLKDIFKVDSSKSKEELNKLIKELELIIAGKGDQLAASGGEVFIEKEEGDDSSDADYGDPETDEAGTAENPESGDEGDKVTEAAAAAAPPSAAEVVEIKNILNELVAPLDTNSDLKDDSGQKIAQELFQGKTLVKEKQIPELNKPSNLKNFLTKVLTTMDDENKPRYKVFLYYDDPENPDSLIGHLLSGEMAGGGFSNSDWKIIDRGNNFNGFEYVLKSKNDSEEKKNGGLILEANGEIETPIKLLIISAGLYNILYRCISIIYNINTNTGFNPMPEINKKIIQLLPTFTFPIAIEKQEGYEDNRNELYKLLKGDVSYVKGMIDAYKGIVPSAGGSFKRIRRRLKDTQKRKQSKSKHRRTLKIKTI